MKKILFLWRKDIKHEKFGWSEVVIHEYMKWLASKWYEVTQISTNSKNNLSSEIIDWIKIIRVFNIHYIYFIFWVYYIIKLRGKYDIIIDHAGGIPMLTPWYEKKIPILFFVHHVGDKEWWEYFQQWLWLKFIGNIFRQIYNNIVLRTYKNKPTITVSQWTANELNSLWFDNIYILPNTTNVKISPLSTKPKENNLTMLWRIVPNKRVDHAIQIIKKLRDIGYIYKLNIIGNTQDKIEYARLCKIIMEEKLSNQIVRHGILSDENRNDILDNSKYLLITSIKEWFGVVVLEANARWIPAIWYDIPWVSEAISDNVNWKLIENDNIDEIVNFIIKTNEKEYADLINSTNKYIINYPKWDDNVDNMEQIINKYIK